MQSLPPSIQHELDAAIQRTGRTKALTRAAYFAYTLSRLSPLVAENYMVSLYQRMDGPISADHNYNQLEEIEYYGTDNSQAA